MKNISMRIIVFALATIIMPQLSHAADNVEIDINGVIGKFVSISSDTSSKSIDLESNYDQASGVLSAADYEIANIDALSNSKDGYQIKVSTTNGYKLENSEGLAITYSMKFDGAIDMPDNGNFATVSTADGVILDVNGATSYDQNKLEDGLLTLSADVKEDFVFNNGDFSDIVQLTIVAK